MKRPSPDEVLLGLLKARPAHGYDLLEVFHSPAHLGRIWNMSTSQLYAVLKRLEQSGAITGRELPGSDAPSRTEYVITPLGEQQLTAWLDDQHPPTSIHRIRVQFLSRLYIASLLHLPTETIIARQMTVCETQRAKMQAESDRAASSVEALTLNFVIGQLGSAITWLQHCQEHPLAIPADLPSANTEPG